MIDEDKGQTDQKNFMQKHKNVTCYKCGKKGYYANKFPSGDSDDDELSTRSSTKQQQTKPHWIEWLVC
jgi:cytochrome b involved in lipid metabolism